LKSCDEYQLALEMRRHGALDPAESREVEAHLTTCAECRLAETQAEAVTAMLRNPPPPHPSQEAAILERAAKEARRESYLPVGVLLSFILQGALLSWLIAPDAMLRVWSLFWIAGAVGAAGSALLLRGHLRRARAAMTQGVEAWISDRRKTLLEYRARMKLLRFVGPALTIGTGAAAVRATAQGAGHIPLLWGVTILFAVGAMVMLRYGAAVERELRALDEVGP
jgi:anti-sigma factor RsiW